MNNPICLSCYKVFNGKEFLQLMPITDQWTTIKCPYCGEHQSYRLELEWTIRYTKKVDTNEKV